MQLLQIYRFKVQAIPSSKIEHLPFVHHIEIRTLVNSGRLSRSWPLILECIFGKLHLTGIHKTLTNRPGALNGVSNTETDQTAGVSGAALKEPFSSFGNFVH